jgi:hypothetical protein
LTTETALEEVSLSKSLLLTWEVWEIFFFFSDLKKGTTPVVLQVQDDQIGTNPVGDSVDS